MRPRFQSVTMSHLLTGIVVEVSNQADCDNLAASTYSYLLDPDLLVPMQQGKSFIVILLLSDLRGADEFSEGAGNPRSLSGSVVGCSGLPEGGRSRSTHPKRELPWSKMA